VSGKTIVELVPGWDAALTYDVLESGRLVGVFVGRKDLLGPLVNAIGQPDRRGTYLVSGYRGAGKTTLVIEAARLAKQELKIPLLPLVLNVSEVSASLESANEGALPPLGIDPRRLLTALLRALRNQVTDKADKVAIELIQTAYEKAEAARYSETSDESAERSHTRTSETSVAVKRVLHGVCAAAGLAAVGLGVAATTRPITGAIVALAGAAGLSFAASVKTTRLRRHETRHKLELVRDNSLHQVESDLKDILAELAKTKRTMFVLEELDKVDDEEGKQLDAVIRYFKNLFTQAPALFFFLTDKRYYDVVDANIAKARRNRSYALEHTFFTHRVFVPRPSVDECLAYFSRVLTGPEAKTALAHIADASAVRSLPLSDMDPLERFLRALLFWSQNHVFDLKNEMRRYVRVVNGTSELTFDDQSFPLQEQAIAPLQFVLEQKVRLYRFGGGRDYANEVLRNCLSSVFANLGGDARQPYSELHPRDDELRVTERARVVEAVDSLLGDLERGGVIERHDEVFAWRPPSAFVPAPRLEPHEEALKSSLLETARRCAPFAAGGVLEPFGMGATELIESCRATIDEMQGAALPLSLEEADRRRVEAQNALRAVLDAIRSAHLARVGGGKRVNTSVSSSVTLVSRRSATVVVVHGLDEEFPARQDDVPIAIVLVDLDVATFDHVRRERVEAWRRMFGDGQALILYLRIDEELASPAEAVDRWGRRLEEELVFAELWAVQRAALADDAVRDAPAWLSEEWTVSAAEAFESWRRSGARALGAPPTAVVDARALARLLNESAVKLPEPALLALALPDTDPADAAARERLAQAGRLVALEDDRADPERLTILYADEPPPALRGAAIPTLRQLDTADALWAVAFFIRHAEPDRARALTQAAAQGESFPAMMDLVLRGNSDWDESLLDAPAELLLETADKLEGSDRVRAQRFRDAAAQKAEAA
jgi:hypothetical protein